MALKPEHRIKASNLANAAANKAKKAGRILGNAAEAVAEKAPVVAKETKEKLSTAASDLQEKTSAFAREMKLKRLNPLFPEEYASPDFDTPKLIVIVDEDERKGIELCEGAIGWMKTNTTPEVLYLYEGALNASGLSFHPMPVCEAAYFRDQFNHSRYIMTSQFLEVTKADQITELKHIARMLGAKECRLEYAEEERIGKSGKKSLSSRSSAPIPKAPMQKASVSTESKTSFDGGSFTKRTVVFHETFDGKEEPVMPVLKWFENDAEIKNLIEARFAVGSDNKMREYKVHLQSAACMTMSSKQAHSIDASLGTAKAKGSFSMEAAFNKESNKDLFYYVIF